MSDAEPPTTQRATGRRVVSSLSASQIQHKRDLDRKAQRALRQRTKVRIQELENDLSRFKESVSERDKAMIEEIRQLREQNRQLKNSLQSIGHFALSQIPDMEGIGPARRGSLEEIQEGLDLPATDSPEPHAAGSQADLPNSLAIPNSGTYPGNEAGTPDAQGLGSHPAITSSSISDHFRETPDNSALSTATHLQTTTPRHSIPPGSTTDNAELMALAVPKHTAGTCPLDHILLDFIASRQALAAKGTPISEVLGPDEACPMDILSPGGNSTTHAISRVMGETLATFPHVKLPEKMAFMYIMHRTTRWQIWPNSETYASIPVWLRPTAMQIVVPHAAWIDNIPWPRVRDILIEQPEKYPFVLFSEFYSHHLSVNWSYDPEDIVLQTEDGLVLNTIFEKHIQRLSNWTVSRQFREYFSEWTSDVYVDG